MYSADRSPAPDSRLLQAFQRMVQLVRVFSQLLDPHIADLVLPAIAPEPGRASFTDATRIVSRVSVTRKPSPAGVPATGAAGSAALLLPG